MKIVLGEITVDANAAHRVRCATSTTSLVLLWSLLLFYPTLGLAQTEESESSETGELRAPASFSPNHQDSSAGHHERHQEYSNPIGISAGFHLPYLQDNSVQTLNRNIAFQGDAWFNSPFHHDHQIHLTAFYETFAIKNIASMGITMYGGMIGYQLRAHGRYGSQTLAFVSLDVGAVNNIATFSQTTTSISNSALVLAAQLCPGLDVPVYKSFGAVFQLPLRFDFNRSILMVVNPSVSVRMAL